MDIFSTEKRSEIMGCIRSKDTKPEMTVRSLTHRLGYRFRLHRSDLPGCPDLVFPKHRKIIFVHGCFWHRHEGCRKASTPKTRTDFWTTKLESNKARDAKNEWLLREAGWNVMIVWECETRNSEKLAGRISGFLRND